MSDINVSIEEVNKAPDGNARCELKTDDLSITLEGKQEYVTRALSALFNELGAVILSGMTQDEIRELLRQFRETTADLKDDATYHLQSKVKTG